ncbi:hypothetical protein EOL96_01515 [Candidatus Saccharibacteria bacterium]|nr:hypothetical protein [Candidatus Saccharibacteria bacterium]
MKTKQYTHNPALEAVGWVGTALILVGYGAFSTGFIADVGVYHTFNFIGSFGVGILSFYRRVWQPFIINIAFASFAIIALFRLSL